MVFFLSSSLVKNVPKTKLPKQEDLASNEYPFSFTFEDTAAAALTTKTLTTELNTNFYVYNIEIWFDDSTDGSYAVVDDNGQSDIKVQEGDLGQSKSLVRYYSYPLIFKNTIRIRLSTSVPPGCTYQYHVSGIKKKI